MIAHKITVQVGNNDWYQIGSYLIVKQMDIFKAHKITIVEDEGTASAIQQFAKNLHDNESFIALETSLKVENSTLFK